MLQKNKSKDDILQSLTETYQCIGAELEHVNRFLKEELSDSVAFIDDVAQYAFQLGGKRLRPALVLLTGKACQEQFELQPLSQQLITIAAAVEMIHTATLIHDDILDEAMLRRHLPTMHQHWDTRVCVMAGDMIFTKALNLAAKLDQLEPYRVLSNACYKTCYGELQQMGTCGRLELSADEYLDIVAGKTAALLECSCQLGAFYSNASDESVQLFRQFGKELGIAFQIIDDLLDVTGNEQQMGKTLGTDIAQQKPTLPLILYLESLSDKEQSEVVFNCKNAEYSYIQELVTKIVSSNTVAETVLFANRHIDHALECLQAYESNVALSNEAHVALNALREIALFVVKRNH